MKHLTELILVLLIVFVWMTGIVMAQGWMKVLALLFPPYPIYLVVERVLQAYGVTPCL
jgi:hypothetical protein